MSALFIQYTTKKRDMWGGLMKRRTLLGGTSAVAMLGLTSSVGAQQPPIKIGMSMAQTGGLAGGGKASLLGIEIWRDDINAKGGLLGRQVELVVYDDKSSASETPAIYSKLLDVDKVDILFAPYATVPTAPLMPLVKQGGIFPRTRPEGRRQDHRAARGRPGIRAKSRGDRTRCRQTDEHACCLRP